MKKHLLLKFILLNMCITNISCADGDFFTNFFIRPYIDPEWGASSNQVKSHFSLKAPYIGLLGVTGWASTLLADDIFEGFSKPKISDYVSSCPGYTALAAVLVTQLGSATFWNLFSDKVPLWKKAIIGGSKALTIAASVAVIHRLNTMNSPIQTAIGAAYATWLLDTPNRILLKPHI
jgi:hypothetical protein